MNSRIIKLLILIIFPVIFLTGCSLTWKDIEDAVGKDKMVKGTSCSYYYSTEKYNGVEKIAFYIDEKGLYLEFNDTNRQTMATPTSIKNDYTFLNVKYTLSETFGESYFNLYKANKSCPRTIYIDGKNNSFSVSAQHPPGDPIKDYAYTIEAIQIGDSKCHNTDAKVCENVRFANNSRVGTKYFEWGYASGEKYFWIANDSAFNSPLKMGQIPGRKSLTVIDGYTTYEIPEKSINDIWLKNNNVLSKDKIDASAELNDEYTLIYIFSKDNPISSGTPIDNWQTIDGEDIGDDSTTSIDTDIPEHTCTSLLGDPTKSNPPSPAYLLTFAFKIVRYIALILLVVLSTMDFIESTSSQDKDSINKAINKLITRAILCVIIFLLPSIIEFVLTFLNDRAVNTCINT